MSSFPAIDVVMWVVGICGGLTTKTAYSELKSTRKRKQRKSIILKVLLVERVRGYFGNSRAKVARLGAEKKIVPSQQYRLQIAKAFKMGVSVLKSKDRDAASRLFQIFKEVSRDNF